MRKAWLYVITHVPTSRVYVGKSINPKERWKQHKKLATHEQPPRYSTYLRNSMAMHGVEEFTFEVVSEHESEEAAYEAERVLIARLRANDPAHGFNLESGGRASKAPNPESIEKTATKNRGKKRTPEQRERMRQAAIARAPMSDETRAKVSEAVRRRMSDPAARERSRETARANFTGAEHTYEHRQKITMTKMDRGTLCPSKEQLDALHTGNRRENRRR